MTAIHLKKRVTSVSAALALMAAIALATLALGEDPKPAPPKPAPAADPSPNLALVPADAIGFVHINVAALWNSEPVKAIRKEMGGSLEEFLDAELELGVPLSAIEAYTLAIGPKPADPGEVAIVTTGKPYDRPKVLANILGETRVHQHKGKVFYAKKEARPEGEPEPAKLNPWANGVYPIDDHTYVVGRVEVLQHLIDHPVEPGAKGPLSPALGAAAGKHHLVAGLTVPKEHAKLLEEFRLRAIRRGEDWGLALQAIKPVTEARVSILTFDLGVQSEARLTLTYANEARAKEAVDEAKDGLALLRLWFAGVLEAAEQEPEGAALIKPLKPVGPALRHTTVEQKGTSVEVSERMTLDMASLGQTAARFKEAAERTRTVKNLSQICMAIHMYHHDYNQLPPGAIYSKDGKPLLSWRVAILPYLEQGELYKQFKLDEPWDSQHNKKLLEKMPRVYAPVMVKTKEPYTTFCQGFNGPGAIFETDPKNFEARASEIANPGEGPLFEFGPKLTLSQGSLPDGTSSIIVVVEAGEPVPWTKPADLPFDPKNPPKNLEGAHKGGFHAVFMDRSVRFIKKGIDPKTLGCLIDRRDGIVVDLDDLK